MYSGKIAVPPGGGGIRNHYFLLCVSNETKYYETHLSIGREPIMKRSDKIGNGFVDGASNVENDKQASASNVTSE
jgi:hypothetical protein